MAGYEHILLACDFSDNFSQVIEKVKTLKNLYHSSLSLIHVIEPIPAYGYPGAGELASPYIDAAQKELEQLAKQLQVPAANTYIEFGSVKKAVLKKADALNIDLLVIGSHGRHGLSRLLGSSAHALVIGAKCDVMTVRCK